MRQYIVRSRCAPLAVRRPLASLIGAAAALLLVCNSAFAQQVVVQPQQEVSQLRWVIDSMGWSYSLLFLFLSFSLVALFITNLLSARRSNVLPGNLIADFEAHIERKEYPQAYALAHGDGSCLGRVLAAGLSRLSSGYAQAIEGMQEIAEEENMKLEHRLSYVALIGSLAPMVGLLGTVHGMVTSFQVIAFSGEQPTPQELAKGISTALWTTLVGLAIAIPAIASYGILRNRVARLVLEVGIIGEGLMQRFRHLEAKRPG